MHGESGEAYGADDHRGAVVRSIPCGKQQHGARVRLARGNEGGETTGDRSEARTGARTGGAVQGEEVDEREQRGADDERRHGRRQRATAALAGRRHRQQRGRRLLLVLVPLHAARGRASAATCSAPEPEAGKSVVGLVRLVKCSCLLPAFSCKKQANFPRASRV